MVSKQGDNQCKGDETSWRRRVIEGCEISLEPVQDNRDQKKKHQASFPSLECAGIIIAA